MSMKKQVRKVGAIGCLGVVIGAVVVNIVLWATNHLELMAGLWIGASIGGVVAWVLSGLWSGLLFKSGAEIGVRQSDADADVEEARWRAMGEMFRTVRQAVKNEPQSPMLQQQVSGWLPEYPVDGEFSELPEPTIAERLQKRLNLQKGEVQ